MLKTCSRSNALIALLLLVSAACLGQVMALYAPGLLDISRKPDACRHRLSMDLRQMALPA
jgi:hypothetical protein